MVQRREIAICIILTIVTCGIYGIYWFICLTDDTNAISGRMDDTSGVVAFLLSLITCNIYGLYWAYKQGEKIDQVKSQRGFPSGSNGIAYLLLCLFGFSIVAYALMQNELNKLA
ncbi:MAG: DUF4234 domain-containing protein [Lachnospiraceae bacterium]|nr:DUF4234 domain-containing protein [Lachnospiraceae bacterium]